MSIRNEATTLKQSLTIDERSVLDQALTDYMEGVERNCEDDELKEHIEAHVESLIEKLL